ncbi:outer membrane protein transport protein [uncultured Nonlabens sp.]|uniref:OmpP1/FadL family transporter n=1 Tax=uncultured Nonlabens sp. TaxID=859306 RepID=UPI002611500A|nr:outer membrane protein transport protein [uncultured Nonlabens sp.]
MKNILILSALLASAFFSDAQTVSDGLLYTGQDLKGTARYRGLSGAFGALGGDLSAIGSNPASSVVFANNYAGVSLNFTSSDNTSNYFGTTVFSDEGDIEINQAGGVLVFQTPESRKVTKFAMSLNYDVTRNFDNSLRVIGTSPISISQYFLNNASGIAVDNFTVRTTENESISDLYLFLGQDIGFNAQQGFLGYESFLINSTTDSPDGNTDLTNTVYTSATGTGSFNQDYLVETAGYNSKFSFNGALELNKKWNLGINLNSHIISLERFTSIEEGNSNADATITDVRFDNRVSNEGNGFSFQLGLIGKVTDNIRVGATYESPTWYTIEQTQNQEIITLSNDGTLTTVSPNILNVFAPYKLRSPGSVTGSIAYIFGKKGLLSLDYNTRDYSQLKYSPDDSDLFVNNNTFIENNLSRASSVRIGGEYRINNWTLRGGYRMEESPYDNKAIMDDLTGYSLGLGYSWGKTILDISYDHSERDYSQQLFDSGLDTPAGVLNELDNIVVTLGFNL